MPGSNGDVDSESREAWHGCGYIEMARHTANIGQWNPCASEGRINQEEALPSIVFFCRGT